MRYILLVFTFDGKYGSSVLKDVSCVLVFTWAGKNMEATMGKWKGVLYTSDTGTTAEREAVNALLRVMMASHHGTLRVGMVFTRTSISQIISNKYIWKFAIDKNIFLVLSKDSWRILSRDIIIQPVVI